MHFKKLIAGTLESPDTWEVALSGGADKKETFERLLREGNLGYLAVSNLVKFCSTQIQAHAWRYVERR